MNAAVVAENALTHLIGDVGHPLLKIVATALAYIYTVIPNFALAIAILTVIIMALLTPLTIKGTKSMLAMQALQPEMQKLRQKYKGPENRTQLNQELMRLYREAGVSPTGGCLPILLQMPALYVLYFLLRNLTLTKALGTLIPTGYYIPKGTIITTGRLLRVGTKLTHSIVSNGTQRCGQKACAFPQYIPTTSKMYQHLVATPGVMKSFGMNLALRPLSPQPHWWMHVPFFIFLVVAVGLQYFQMNQMMRRNKAAAQANPQMQTMQKIMPLIFAYIYFLVSAGTVIYMIVSSAIRILTQDLIFRFGIVEAPAAAGKEVVIPASAKSAKTTTAKTTAKAGVSKSGNGAVTKAAGTAKSAATNGSTKAKSTAGATAAKRRAARADGAVGTADEPVPEPEPEAKPHPRSKDKRERRAR